MFRRARTKSFVLSVSVTRKLTIDTVPRVSRRFDGGADQYFDVHVDVFGAAFSRDVEGAVMYDRAYAADT